MTRGNVRPVWYALAANLAVAAAKLVAWGLTGSGALLAESLHSIADTGNQGLLLFGLRQARQPPSVKHPLGQGRAIYFWSFIVALMLFSLGGLLSIYEGVQRVLHRVDLESPLIGLVTLVVAAVFEGGSLRAALRAIEPERHGRSFWRWFRESRRSALIIVAAEDSAALLGLVFAFVALLASYLTGNALYDALGSIAVGLVLIATAIAVSVQIKSLLVGESASPHVREAIARFLAGQPQLGEIRTLITLQHGDAVIVIVKSTLRDVPGAQMRADMKRCEADLIQAFPQVQQLLFQPV